MTRHEQEALFARMASDYMDTYGGLLRHELAGIDKQPPIITPRMDRRVRKLTGRATAGRWLAGAGMLAACLLILLMSPWLWNQSRYDDISSSHETEDAAPAEDGTAEEAPEDTAPGYEYEIIPLSFALPESLTVSAVDQDHGKSIYRLADAMQDDVVLTMEYAAEPESFDGLVEIRLEGGTVYGWSGPDYKLIVFEQDGIRYELTCQYDINTLVPLSESILERI